MRVKLIPSENGRYVLLLVEGVGAEAWAEDRRVDGERWTVQGPDRVLHVLEARRHLAEELRAQGYEVDASDMPAE